MPDASPNVFTGTLGGFAAADTNFATGAPAFPGVQTAWNQNDVVVYRFTLTLQNNAGSGRHDLGAAQLHVGGAEPVDRLGRSRAGRASDPPEPARQDRVGRTGTGGNA